MKGGEEFQSLDPPTHLPRKLFTLSFACHKFMLVPRRSLFIIPLVCPLGQRGHWSFLAREVESSKFKGLIHGDLFKNICLFREKEVYSFPTKNIIHIIS
jgi:hypothetical protein